MNYKKILKEQLLSELLYNKGANKSSAYGRKLIDSIGKIKYSPLDSIDPNQTRFNLDLSTEPDSDPGFYYGSGRPKINPKKFASLKPQRIIPSNTLPVEPRYF